MKSIFVSNKKFSSVGYVDKE
jgi:hypothetical protein